jgi:Fur family zinc uptake transcriptional regulator
MIGAELGRGAGILAIDHDHSFCVTGAMARADALCAARGVRLTPVRRRVLELIWRSHAPVGAYAMLDVLRLEGFNAQPPTVYRALEFLSEQGLIHRLESRNAFIGCPSPDHPHQALYLICTHCGTVEEQEDSPDLAKALTALADKTGFRIAGRTLELTGLCRRCSATQSAA